MAVVGAAGARQISCVSSRRRWRITPAIRSWRGALRRRDSLSVWFDPTMAWHAAKTGRRGRPETFSESAIQTCLTLKVLFGLPLRQTVGLVAGLIEMTGLDWPVPDYSTLCRRQARLAVQIPYCRPDSPVTLLADSTGDLRAQEVGIWAVCSGIAQMTSVPDARPNLGAMNSGLVAGGNQAACFIHDGSDRLRLAAHRHVLRHRAKRSRSGLRVRSKRGPVQASRP